MNSISEFSTNQRPHPFIVVEGVTGQGPVLHSPVSPHPFEKELMVPLRKSLELLESAREDRAALGAMQELAQEMVSFIGETLAQARLQPNAEEKKLGIGGPIQIPIHVLIHDLRNPLNTILANLEVEPIDIEALRKGYEELAKSAEAMNRADVQMMVIQRPFALSRLVEKVKTATLNRGLIQFVCSQPELVVNGDLEKIHRVLNNLIFNAIEVSKQVNVHIDAKEAGDKVHLSFRVVDDGPGMDEKTKGKLFKLESGQGDHGFGLYISQEFVKAMGGKIQVESTLMVGSTFSFDLELQKGNLEEIVPSPNPFQNARHIDIELKKKDVKILWADDSSVKPFQIMLHNAKHSGVFTHAKTGEDAIQAFKAKTYDIAILDMHMGKKLMTGLETAQAIHRLAVSNGILHFPFLLVTGATREEEESIEKTAADENLNLKVVIKPIDKNRLISLLNHKCPTT